MFEELIEDMIVDFVDFDKYDEDREYGKLSDLFYNIFGVRLEVSDLIKYTQTDLYDMLLEKAKKTYESKRESIGNEAFVSIQKYILLKMIDDSWKEHLTGMDDLEEGIGLRAYGQKDPLVEYKIEGTMMFEQMIEGIKENCVSMIFKIQPIKEEVIEEELKPKKQVYFTNREETETVKTIKRDTSKIGRNDMCPCGSGKKYKKCCGV